MNKKHIIERKSEQKLIDELMLKESLSSQTIAKPNVSSRLYWLRRFRFARKYMGGAWIRTKFRGWITYQTYLNYKGYNYDPIALVSEEEGVVKWQRS